MKNTEKTLILDADLDYLDDVLSFLQVNLEEHNCPDKIISKICISAEELFVNVANYAYLPGESGSCELLLQISDQKDKKEMILSFFDDGKPFNPMDKEDPDITLSARERQIGGLGIWMVKNMMDDVFYRYENHQNIITIKKVW